MLTKAQRYEKHIAIVLDETGISRDDYRALRRLGLKLRQWFQDECDGSIQTDETSGITYRYDEETHKRIGEIRNLVPGWIRRAEEIVANRPEFVLFVQGDCRGAPIYLLPKDKLGENDPDSIYSSIGYCIY